MRASRFAYDNGCSPPCLLFALGKQRQGASRLPAVIGKQSPRIARIDLGLTGERAAHFLFRQQVVEEPLHRPLARAVDERLCIQWESG